MRYAEAKYGEYATALGEFTSGRTVTIEVYNAATGAAVTLSSNACIEIASTGVFRWSSSNIQTQPTGYTELLFIMTDVTPVVGTGRTQKGKIIVGGFPSDSAVSRFEGRVWLEQGSAYSGTTFPTGTRQFPVNNVTDARTIADNENLKAYGIKGAFTITADHEDWDFEGVTPSSDILNFSGAPSIDRSTFNSCGILGSLSGDITAKESIIGASGGTVTGVSGTFTECGFDGTIQVAPWPGRIRGLSMSALATNILSPSTYLDFNNALCVVLAELKGIWSVQNMSASLPAATLAVSLSGCRLTLEASVQNGTFVLISDGSGELDDSSVGGSLDDFIVRGTRLNQVWDGMVGSRIVDQTADPAQWKLRVRKGDSDAVTSHSFDLVDGNGNPISDSNPLTTFIGERNRI